MTTLRRLAVTVLCTAAFASPALAEPATCLSPDPSAWPPPSRPYFLVIFDTSASMSTDVGTASSCGFGTTRLDHARCAFRSAIAAFAGQVNFGLATFAVAQQACPAACACLPGDPLCFSACTYECGASELVTRGSCAGCGMRPGGAMSAAGAEIRVPVQQDAFWTTPTASNVPQLLSWVDGSCGSNAELFAAGSTPLNGALRDAHRYFAGVWVSPLDAVTTLPSPLASQDLACRQVHVVLLTDGDETCDTQADAVAAAQILYEGGVSAGGNVFRIRVHVVNFAGASQVNADQIAAAGGTGAAHVATDEAQLTQALASIVTGALRPETCDNADNDCNGCTDEGFPHFANVGQACCFWSIPAQRDACLASYRASIASSPPDGDRTLLPCTTTAQSVDPALWLCHDPGETCDNIDNDGDGTVDEGQLKCGNPPHCPTAEVCNGQDDDCDGQVDEGGVCTGCLVAPTSEVCDGCDNDCDGLADGGLAVSFPCGLTGPDTPAYCVGTRSCKPAQPVAPGACVAGGGFGACTLSVTPPPESCNGLDDDCNGVVDDGLPATPCAPAGTPPGLDFGPQSQCRMGQTLCSGGATSCVGFVGPSAELCDGIDNDCDGFVDEGVVGVGEPCGLAGGRCTPGTTACVGGSLVCQGGSPPAPETCNGIDDDCDGLVDEGPLADEPPSGANGCWDEPGSCCTSGSLSWCPPAGATCTGTGALQGACRAGSLACRSGAWACAGAVAPGFELACNGQDDDCDGIVDDDAAGAGLPCGTAEGECAVGVTACDGGVLRCSGIGPAGEACNGKDDDCDGTIDEELDCGEGDACTRVTCPAGSTCTLRSGGAVCLKTEETTSGGCGSAGGGAGAVALLLSALALVTRRRRAVPGRAAAGGHGALLAVTALALGACGGTTETREVEVPPAAVGCTPTAGGTETCDGLDNDCNGIVDDVTSAGEPSLGAACFGAPDGLCADAARAGVTRCVAGALVCSGPNVLRPFERAETCNGVDDDCDGIVDDQPVDAGAPCGAGDFPPCGRGALLCQAGQLVCVGAVQPAAETCNGIDDDCNGVVDDGLPPEQSGAPCSVPLPPPAGATSPCQAGTSACVGGDVVCVGAVEAPPRASDACGVDTNCDGTLTGQPEVASDVHNCGACGNDCYAGSVHARWSCVGGSCAFQGCEPGYWDLDGDQRCEYACTFLSAQEACNGVDDDCNGRIDEPEQLTPPPVSGICGVSPAAMTPECTPWHTAGNPGGVSVDCTAGAWRCTFHTPGVCSPSCAAAAEICDTVDNDCDGLVNETTPRWGTACASDDGLPPPGHGACRALGTHVCATATTTTCSAVKNLAAAGPELCDGADNDCDGLVDEPFTSKGSNPTYFVKPAVTRVGASLWIFSHEASRPSATASSAGSGNGYHCIGAGCAGVPSAPAGVTLDETPACSAPNRMPWFNVTPVEAEQACQAMGGRICTTAEWQAACQATAGCSWGYAPRGAACTSTFTGAKFCNLAAGFDFDAGAPGDQDGLLPTASSALSSCWADWSGLQGNSAATERVFDVTGNLRELTRAGANSYPVTGGSFLTQDAGGATCTFTSLTADETFQYRDAGFRCCFSSDPTL